MTRPRIVNAASLPQLDVPPPNQVVLRLLAANPVRDPRTAAGRPLYLHRLGVLAVPHGRDGHGWWCTVASDTLEAPGPAGVAWLDDIEIAAALEVRSPLLVHVDLTWDEYRAVWMVRVWDRWPGGRIIQVAQALAEMAEPRSLSVCTGVPHRPAIARRSGLPSTLGLSRHVEDLAATGLLVPMFTDADADPDRRYQLTLPPAATR